MSPAFVNGIRGLVGFIFNHEWHEYTRTRNKNADERKVKTQRLAVPFGRDQTEKRKDRGLHGNAQMGDSHLVRIYPRVSASSAVKFISPDLQFARYDNQSSITISSAEKISSPLSVRPERP